MPKREPTPPPGDDEPYYFTIINPYPPNASMELQGDMTRLVLWLQAAMDDTNTNDRKALWAIFHKPSSPRLVIIEVSRSYQNVRRLLGQHTWGGPNGFLRSVAPDEAANYSAIFFCHYTTGRQVEKTGWKRKWVESDMFIIPEDKDKKKILKFKDPYPATTYLAVPASDPTALEYCRHLPLDRFPEIGANKNKALEARVGSATWAVKRDQRPLNTSSKMPGQIKDKEVPSPVSEDVNADPTSELKDGEPMNLWEDTPTAKVTTVKLMTDFALASLSGDQERDRLVCPHHGVLCRKMCEWRTAQDPKNKKEGPSNNKNHPKAYKGKKGKPLNHLTSSANPSSAESEILSPKSPSSSSATGRGGNASFKPPTRAPPPPAGFGRPSVVSPVKQTSTETPATQTSTEIPVTQTSTETPAKQTPTEIPESDTPTVTVGIGRGTPNGPPRGAPVWASRGRGRGRA